MPTDESSSDDGSKPKRRLGTLDGMYNIPDDFNTMFQEEIERMFYDGDIFPPDPDGKEAEAERSPL